MSDRLISAGALKKEWFEIDEEDDLLEEPTEEDLAELMEEDCFLEDLEDLEEL